MLRLHDPGLLAGSAREKLQLEEWCFGNIRELLAEMRLPDGWWCAVDLSRTELFGERSGGDVDLIAGPLGLTISTGEFKAFVAEERRVRPGVPVGVHRQLALMRAGREGLVQWPPDVRQTSAIEVKASYFKDERWKATHEGEREKILGSLRERRRLGVNSLAFLHLGVVEPTDDADALDARMDAACRTFPLLFDEPTMGDFGYCIGIMGGVARDGATPWGAQAGPSWIALPKTSDVLSRAWHEGLRQRLATLPRPTFFRTFIHSCASCGVWRHAGSANAEGVLCSCQAAPSSQP